MTNFNSNLTGHLLIATPNLQDSNFHQTVTFICEHNDDGAMGIILNRTSQFLMSELYKELEIKPRSTASTVLYQGGPVQPESGFILHRSGQTWQSTMSITSEISLTTSRDIIESIANDEGPKDYRIALGYAGWNVEQLTNEMAENAWLTTPVTADQIFATPTEQLWHQSANWLGIDMHRLSPHVGHA